MAYKNIWLSAGLAEEIATVTKCDCKTVLHWMREEYVPATAYVLIDLVQNGRLGDIQPDWFGWLICHRSGRFGRPMETKCIQTT